MTYSELIALIRGKNNRSKRKIDNNTTGYIEYDGSASVELHSTKVVVLYPNGLVKLQNLQLLHLQPLLKLTKHLVGSYSLDGLSIHWVTS